VIENPLEALIHRPHTYSLNRSIHMISLFRGTNQLLLPRLKTLISMPQALLLPPLLPMHCKRSLGTHRSMSSSTCLVVFKIPLSTCHRSHQTSCSAVNAVASVKAEAPSGNTRSATSSHGNALTRPATALSPSKKIWNVISNPELTEERAYAITATPPHASMAATGRKMGFLVETIVFGIWKPAGNEFELNNNQNHIDQADQTIHWV
jgi:hypothetical protein